MRVKTEQIKYYANLLLFALFALQLIAGTINFFIPSDFCNVFMYFMNYILLFGIVIILCSKGLAEHFLIICFYFCFFIFLMGQKPFFWPEYNCFRTFIYTTLDTQQYSVFALIMAIGIILPYLSYILLEKYRKSSTSLKSNESSVSDSFRRFIGFCFYATLPFAAYMEFKIVFVRSMESYTGGYLINVDIPAVIKILNYMFNGFAMLYFASRPKPKKMFTAMLLYSVIQGGVQLLQGRRSLFAVFFLFIVWYILKYYDVKKIGKKYIIAFCSGIFLLGILFFVVEAFRGGDSLGGFSPFNAIKDLMISTGGSDSVLANTIVYKYWFPVTGPIYLLDPIINNPLTIILTGKSGIPQGQQFIENFYNFSHWISYIIYPVFYEEGHGMGGCYLAENYMAFGIFGVILISLVMGVVMHFLKRLKFSDNIYLIGFCIILVRYLFTVPRGETFGWFGDFTYYVFVSLLSLPFYFKFRGKNEKQTEHRV